MNGTPPARRSPGRLEPGAAAAPRRRVAANLTNVTQPGRPDEIQVDQSSSAVTLRVRGLVTDERGWWLIVRDVEEEPEWVVPGGRVNPRESPRQACERAVAEESGARVRPGPLIAQSWQPADEDRALPRLTMIFECERVDDAELSDVSPDGHHVVRWAPPLNALASLRSDVATLLAQLGVDESARESTVYLED
jgi:ADP-ribose pyrophosphatase YjhB (NUDIX family)